MSSVREVQFLGTLPPVMEWPWRMILPLIVAAYLLLVRGLRFRELRGLQKRFPMATDEELGSMTVDQAWQIQKVVMEKEFPYMTEKALSFALFKTYGIPTISKLLAGTTEFSSKGTAGKRAVDTAVLIGEFLSNAPTSERACSGISRMNFIHSKYQKAGKISNDDMIYTLALFALEPGRWIQRYEWRPLSRIEHCAFGVFWKSIGDAMHISYATLSSSPTGWRSGLHWLSDLSAWAADYEAMYMVPTPSNRVVADYTTKILTYGLPSSVDELGRQFAATLMDERLRIAMGYERAPSWLYNAVHAGLWVRKGVVRWMMLPRWKPATQLSDPDPKTGRLYRTMYLAEPWYVPESYRWKVQAWARWLFGMSVPGKEWKSQGYLIEEVGPFGMVGKGRDEFEQERNGLMKGARNGCPFGKI